MKIDDIEIQKGFLVRAPLPRYTNVFCEVANVGDAYVDIVLSTQEEYGWNTYPWCDPNKKYWRLRPGDVSQIKGYLSS